MRVFVRVGTTVLVGLALASPASAPPAASDTWQTTIAPNLIGGGDHFTWDTLTQARQSGSVSGPDRSPTHRDLIRRAS